MKKLLYTIIAVSATCSAIAQLPNGGFEQWDSSSVINGQTIYNPLNWLTTNAEMVGLNMDQPVKITTDAHSGNYAVKITSGINDNGQQAGILVSGDTYSGSFDQPDAGEKFKLTGRIASFEGYYKYQAPATDSFRIVLAFYRKGAYYGRAYFQGGPTAGYTKFNLELINYSGPAPDSAKFIIYSSYSLSSGSNLYLDDMNVGYIRTGVNDPGETFPGVSIYPNPATDQLILTGLSKEHISYTITDLKGTLQGSGDIGAEHVLNVSALNPGMYFLRLTDDKGNVHTQKIIRQE